MFSDPHHQAFQLTSEVGASYPLLVGSLGSGLWEEEREFVVLGIVGTHIEVAVGSSMAVGSHSMAAKFRIAEEVEQSGA